MICIICGGGKYPLEIANYCKQNSVDAILVFLKGFYNHDYDWPNFKNKILKLGDIGELLNFLKENSVTDIIFAGNVTRPDIRNLSLDSTARQWLLTLGSNIFSGDDGILKAVAKLFEEEGFRVISGTEFINSLTVDSYNLSHACISNNDVLDIKKGIAILSLLSDQDIGQSIIIENNIVLGIECAEGTDSLIKRCVNLKKCINSGVLVKISKENQDLRIDMPTIGLDTVKNCYEAGLNGIAIERKRCIFLNQTEAVDFANSVGMFIIAVDRIGFNKDLYV